MTEAEKFEAELGQVRAARCALVVLNTCPLGRPVLQLHRPGDKTSIIKRAGGARTGDARVAW